MITLGEAVGDSVEEKTIANFQQRTGLPAEASRERLKNIGARYLRTDSFEKEGLTYRLEQMQLGRGKDNYMWKRIIPETDESNIPFVIHLEVTPRGYTRYPSPT